MNVPSFINTVSDVNVLAFISNLRSKQQAKNTRMGQGLSNPHESPNFDAFHEARKEGYKLCKKHL
jgi:hypothetical protein